MSAFDYFQCPDCDFSSVQRESFRGSDMCPICAGDCGHDVRMRRRTATAEDRPEGRDARNEEPTQ